MRNELDLIELADRFLRNELSGTERAAFAVRMEDSAEIRELVEDQRLLLQGLERMAQRVAVVKAYRSYRFGRWAPGIGGAAVVAVLVTTGIWSYTHNAEHTMPEAAPVPAPEVQDEPGLLPWADSTLQRTTDSTVIRVDTIRTVSVKRYRSDTAIRVVRNEVVLDVNTATEAFGSVDPSAGVVRNTADLSPKPSFPGGDVAMGRYLMTNLKYPEEAEKKGIQGRIVTSFIVMTDGSITDAKVVRGIDPACDQEALRVIRNMPNWVPGKLNNKLVNVRLEVPIVFMQGIQQLN